MVVSFSLQLENDTGLLQEVWSGDEDKMGGGWDEIEGQMDERREASGCRRVDGWQHEE